MGLYSKYVLPKIIRFSCSMEAITQQRQKVVPLAHGQVVEIGIGSGLNLPLYNPQAVERVYGIDPSAELRPYAERAAVEVPFEVELVPVSAEEIPLQNEIADTVVVTYTLCTIPDPIAALREMRRLLRPTGSLLVAEHGRSPDERVARWQNRLTPLWKKLGGGCHLNRDVPELIRQGGFKIDSFETAYLPGPKPLTFNYWGTAVPA